MEFRDISHELNKLLSKDIRQANGIFFTPTKARKIILNKIKEYSFIPRTILEPSFGSGEFIQDIVDEYPLAIINGVEYNKEIFDKVYNNIKNKNINLINDDFLNYKSEPVDLIIGNPPYFVTKQKNIKCMTGRGNIFVQFIYKCLTEHLNPDGILAFVLPTSLYNCSYYEPCRKYIQKNNTILHMENIQVDYYDTKQDTMILILKNKKCNLEDPPYIVSYQNRVYLSPYYKEIKELLVGTTTLKELGFQVKTGEVVWNQHKEKLSNDSVNGTLLIYSTNISSRKLELNIFKESSEKKQYIENYNGIPITSPAFLVTRGYGNCYKFEYIYIDNYKFYAENHINVITPLTPDAIKSVKRVNDSFEDPKMKKFIKMFIGNGALSKTELEEIVPIF